VRSPVRWASTKTRRANASAALWRNWLSSFDAAASKRRRARRSLRFWNPRQFPCRRPQRPWLGTPRFKQPHPRWPARGFFWLVWQVCHQAEERQRLNDAFGSTREEFAAWERSSLRREETQGDRLVRLTIPPNPELAVGLSNRLAALLLTTLGQQRSELLQRFSADWFAMEDVLWSARE